MATVISHVDKILLRATSNDGIYLHGCNIFWRGQTNVLFLNGIADGVDKIYDLMKKDARVLMPSPSYPTHTSNEGKRGDYPHLQFRLDPEQGWLPDLEEIENKVRYNPQVVAIALVNPDNPTGAVYPRKTLEGIVAIARRYGLFVICDEIYCNKIGRASCRERV